MSCFKTNVYSSGMNDGNGSNYFETVAELQRSEEEAWETSASSH